MGNEDKIKDLVSQSKKIFLKDELVNLDDKTHLYNLDVEFAKTKQNKNFWVYLTSLGLLGIVIIIGYIIMLFYQYNAYKTTIIIQEFENVKLKEILDTKGNFEKEMGKLKTKQSDLKIQLEKDIQKIHNKYFKQKEDVYKQTQSYFKRNRLINELKAKENKEINKLRNKYKQELRSTQREMNSVQGNIDQYDQRFNEAKQKADEMIHNFQKLHNLQMREQNRAITLKYNPWFDNSRLKQILEQRIDTKDQMMALQNYDPDLHSKKIISQEDFNSLRQKIEEQKLLIERLNKIPYQNSVGLTMKRLNYLSKSIVNDYEKLWSELSKRSHLLNNYEHAVNHLTKAQSENGYIIDARNNKDITLYLNTVYKIKNNDTALVFRNEDEYIATIKLYYEGKELKGEVLELQQGKNILPFDKILIQVAGAKKIIPRPQTINTNK